MTDVACDTPSAGTKTPALEIRPDETSKSVSCSMTQAGAKADKYKQRAQRLEFGKGHRAVTAMTDSTFLHARYMHDRQKPGSNADGEQHLSQWGSTDTVPALSQTGPGATAAQIPREKHHISNG